MTVQGDPYIQGTVSIANGSPNLVGVGTAWSLLIDEGDSFQKNGLSVDVLTVVDDTHITLAENWLGTTLSAATYRIRLFSPLRRAEAPAQTVRDMLAYLTVFRQ